MYIGRFAPSPTGPLHFGSLLAALASYLEAKQQQGKWLLRIEDLDKPREVAGAAATILQQLTAFGFEWDGEIIYQSKRHSLYQDALETLKKRELIYPCTCTRKEIADSATQHGVDGIIYPGTCTHQTIKTGTPSAWRIKTDDSLIHLTDRIQGVIKQRLSLEIGDFILKRADGLFAYQLAVVVDDALQGITHIVRGADLLDSTPRQIYLQQQLFFATPHYAHIPVACNIQGEKLSKQTLAESIHSGNANTLIWQALRFLGQQVPIELKNDSLTHLWQWALSHWKVSQVPQIRHLEMHHHSQKSTA